MAIQKKKKRRIRIRRRRRRKRKETEWKAWRVQLKWIRLDEGT